jgi:hypothetical protein
METICQKLEVRPLFTVNNLCGKSGMYSLNTDEGIVYYLDNETKVLTLQFCKVNTESHSLDAISKSVFTFPEMVGDVIDIHFIKVAGGRINVTIMDALKQLYTFVIVKKNNIFIQVKI